MWVRNNDFREFCHFKIHETETAWRNIGCRLLVLKRFNNSLCNILLTAHSTHTKVEQLTWLEAIWIPPLKWREGFRSNPLHLKQKTFDFRSTLVVVEQAGALQCSRIFYYGTAGSSARLGLTSHFISIVLQHYDLHCLSAGAVKPQIAASVQHSQAPCKDSQ